MFIVEQTRDSGTIKRRAGRWRQDLLRFPAVNYQTKPVSLWSSSCLLWRRGSRRNRNWKMRNNPNKPQLMTLQIFFPKSHPSQPVNQSWDQLIQYKTLPQTRRHQTSSWRRRRRRKQSRKVVWQLHQTTKMMLKLSQTRSQDFLPASATNKSQAQLCHQWLGFLLQFSGDQIISKSTK